MYITISKVPLEDQPKNVSWSGDPIALAEYGRERVFEPEPEIDE